MAAATVPPVLIMSSITIGVRRRTSPDEAAHAHLRAAQAALVHDRDREPEEPGVAFGQLHRPEVGRDDHRFGRNPGPDGLGEDGDRAQVLEGDREASFDRGRVEIDCDHAVEAARLHELGNETRAERLACVRAPVLPGVAEVGNDARGALGTRAAARVREEEKLEEMLADGRPGRLHDVDVIAPDVLADLDLHLAIGKMLEHPATRPEAETAGDRLGERWVRRPGEDVELHRLARAAGALEAAGFARRCSRNQSVARRTTSSSVPGSSKRWLAPGTIVRRFSQRRRRSAFSFIAITGTVVAADDEQRRRLHAGQNGRGEVGTAAARDHGGDGGVVGRGQERGGRSRAGPEVPDREVLRGRLAAHPLGGAAQPAGEELHVEDQGPVLRLVGREEVEEQRRDGGVPQRAGDVGVARAQPAAAAAVGEEDEPASLRRNAQQPFEHDRVGRNAHCGR